jgi:hypothetical protein
MRDRLDVPIPDLTTLEFHNDGDFPTDKVHQIIDGRLESPTHRSRTMPVWGLTFQSTGRESDQEHAVDQMIDALTRYLESMQGEAGASTGGPNNG